MPIEINRLGPAAQRQIIQKLGEKKRSKYGNVPTTRITPSRKEIKFDSQAEARRYDELMILLRTGQIQNLKLQPEFTITEAFTSTNGNHCRAMRYRADFSYTRNGELVVEDVKSKATKTQTYRNKKKAILDKYGIEIAEIE